MFGYIRPLESELRVKEQAVYRAYYCGLCKTIGRRYGQGARAALNYDCTFLALFLSAFTEAPACEAGGCFVKPYRARRPIAPPQDALDFAADVNVLLAWYQLDDDWRDERRAGALCGRTLLGTAAARAKKRQPELADGIAGHLSALSEIERKRTAETDMPADAFGSLLRDIVRSAPMLPEGARKASEWMFYNLGRWIYLTDAWEDREKDTKRGAYNPFMAAETPRADASFLLYVSLTEAEKGFDLLDPVSHVNLLGNIVHLGCRERTRAALKENLNEPV